MNGNVRGNYFAQNSRHSKRPSGYNIEYDRGKTKKIKNKLEAIIPLSNPFQMTQNLYNQVCNHTLLSLEKIDELFPMKIL